MSPFNLVLTCQIVLKQLQHPNLGMYIYVYTYLFNIVSWTHGGRPVGRQFGLAGGRPLSLDT